MSAHLATPGETRTPRLSVVLGLAFLFWVFTYGLIVLRAELILQAPPFTLGFRRLFGTLAGAVAYGLVLRWIFAADQKRGFSQALAIIGTILPASLLVLAVRAVANVTLYETPQPWEENIRWVLVWSGYFGLWVSATLAFQHALAAKRSPAPIAEPVSTAKAANDDTIESLSLAWLAFIQAAAEEMHALPEADRAALVDRLSQSAAYDLADDEWSAGAHNARVELTRRILQRMADQD